MTAVGATVIQANDGGSPGPTNSTSATRALTTSRETARPDDVSHKPEDDKQAEDPTKRQESEPLSEEELRAYERDQEWEALLAEHPKFPYFTVFP